ncbi:MAG: small multi-drug export protein [Spirochaetes bacterium]|nr:small multi-drug export protein [Spirochaetota bacterium]
MDPLTLIITVGLSFLPISELRGAIPFAVARGMPLLEAAAIAVACNALVGPVAFAFLETFHKLFYRWGFYARVFDRFVAKARAKVHEKVERYGYLGIMLFVAVPLPITGAWTGVLGAWILGMDRKKTMLAVAAGVLVSGVIVSLVVGFGVEALSLFIKRV